MKKIVFLDIDGTLVDHIKFHKVLDSTILAIQKAQKNGHKIILCTGRTKSNVHPDLIPFQSDGQIYGAGSTVMANGEMLFNVSIPKNDLQDMIHDFDHNHFGYTLEGEFDSYCDDFCYQRRNAFADHKGISNELQAVIGSDDTHFHMKEFDLNQAVMNKISVFSQSKEDLEKFMNKWSNYDFIIHDKKENESHFCIEILIHGISKASGMDIILDYFKMDLADSIAFGDSMNDYDMISHANKGICMANGASKLKKAADYVCGYSYEDSIADMFQKLGLLDPIQ